MPHRSRQQLLDQLTDLRQRLDALIDEVRTGVEPSPATAAPATPAAGQRGGEGGLLGAIDLSDDLRAVYLELLRHEALSMPEIVALPALAGLDGIEILARALARQGQLERFADGDVVKYRPRLGRRAHRQLPDSLWDDLNRP